MNFRGRRGMKRRGLRRRIIGNYACKICYLLSCFVFTIQFANILYFSIWPWVLAFFQAFFIHFFVKNVYLKSLLLLSNFSLLNLMVYLKVITQSIHCYRHLKKIYQKKWSDIVWLSISSSFSFFQRHVLPFLRSILHFLYFFIQLYIVLHIFVMINVEERLSRRCELWNLVELLSSTDC